MANAQTYQSEFTGPQMDQRFAAVAELQAAITELQTAVAAKYSKPSGGIPSTDLDADVNAALAKANSAIQSLADYYTKAEVDALIAAINGQQYVDASSLPTASASTMGKIYLIGPDASGYYSYYYTSQNGSSYSWVGPLGTTEISLANYATKTELNQLEQEVNGVVFTSGKYLNNAANEVSDEAWGISDYIPYTQGNDVYWWWSATNGTVSGRCICFYKEDKTFISNGYWSSGSSSSAGKKITASSIASDAPAAKYIRFSFLLGLGGKLVTGDTTWEENTGLVGDISELQTEMTAMGASAFGAVTNAVKRNQSYIKYSDGELTGTGTYFDTHTIPNRGYSKIKVTVGLSDSNAAAIAFYNGKPGYSETYISGVQGQGGILTYEAAVPSGCKSIVVTNRNTTLATPTIELSASSLAQGAINQANYRDQFKKAPYYFHYQPDGLISDAAGTKLIPGECIASVRMAARLGFSYIEANIKITSDSKYVVMHGAAGGVFGDTVYSLDSSDISDELISSKTLDYIKTNVRYKDVPEKYSEVASLDDFLKACKEANIGIFAGTSYEDAIEMCVKYLGQDNVITYDAAAWTRSLFNGIMFTWTNSSEETTESLLAAARTYGRPYICGIGPGTLAALKTAGTFDSFLKAMHNEGFLVGIASVYQTEAESRDALRRGVDVSGAGHEVNPFTPNYECFDLDGDASQFGGTGSISANVATLADGETITCGSADVLPLGKGEITLRFNGSITVNFGSVGSRSVTSDGSEDIVISDYFLRKSTALVLTATASTTIYVLVYKTSKC